MKRAQDIIAAHASNSPTNKQLFLYYGQHVAHAPLQAPQSVLSRFAALQNTNRRIYTAQVSVCDSAVGDVVASLRAHKMWGRTLLIFFSGEH